MNIENGMANESSADTEFFNQDFTTATRWEVFCARLEEIIHDWKIPFKKQYNDQLAPNVLSLNEWETKEELVTYDGMELKVKLYTIKMDTINDKHKDNNSSESVQNVAIDSLDNGPPSTLPINSQCQTFVDLMSLDNNWCILDDKFNLNTIHPLARWYGLRQFIVLSTVGGAAINENQRRILLSSVHIVIGETNIECPVFVQALKSQQNVYSGNGISNMNFFLYLKTTTI